MMLRQAPEDDAAAKRTGAPLPRNDRLHAPSEQVLIGESHDTPAKRFHPPAPSAASSFIVHVSVVESHTKVSWNAPPGYGKSSVRVSPRAAPVAGGTE
jgi:hypothetical protein